MERYLPQKALWQAMVIIILGCFAGVLVNAVRPDGLRLFGGFSYDDVSDSGDGSDGMRISMEEAEGFHLAQAAVFIDTREASDYEAGHIQGALSLPWSRFEENHVMALEGIDKDAYIICYCDGTACNSSEHVAVALLEQGYANVFVLFNGWSLWKERNLPVEEGPC